MRHAEVEEVLSRDEVLKNAVKTFQGLPNEPDKHAYYDFTRAGDNEPPGTVFEGEPPSGTTAPSQADQGDGDVTIMGEQPSLFPRLGEQTSITTTTNEFGAATTKVRECTHYFRSPHSS